MQFECVAERIHMLVTLPAVGCFGHTGQPVAECFVMVFRHSGVDGDGHIGNCACQ